jgi:hypothetical protein
VERGVKREPGVVCAEGPVRVRRLEDRVAQALEGDRPARGQRGAHVFEAGGGQALRKAGEHV